jgi:hypothetical protein
MLEMASFRNIVPVSGSVSDDRLTGQPFTSHATLVAIIGSAGGASSTT